MSRLLLLRIQPDESHRSFVERNLFIQRHTRSTEIFGAPEFRSRRWRNRQVISIANFLGWDGCYGFNKLLHFHTDYSVHGVLRNKDSASYSANEFEFGSYSFDDFSRTRLYCPTCVKEDQFKRGFSYWRRYHPLVDVCAKHNVKLLSNCQICEKSFSACGHSLDVIWGRCAGRSLGDAEPTANHHPEALHFAQFFESLNALPHHLSAETAFHALKDKLAELVEGDSVEVMSKERRATLRLHRDDLREPRAFRYLTDQYQAHHLLYLIASAFESLLSGIPEMSPILERRISNPEWRLLKLFRKCARV
ncbi:TniQ family protein [Pseudomonas sp. X10]